MKAAKHNLYLLLMTFDRYRHGAAFKLLLVFVIAVLTSCCAFGLPWIVGCKACPTDSSVSCPTTSGNYKGFQCKSGYFNDLASLFMNTNDDAIRNLFSTSTKNEFRISTLFIFFGAIYFLGIITYGIAIPSGLFIPVILAGTKSVCSCCSCLYCFLFKNTLFFIENHSVVDSEILNEGSDYHGELKFNKLHNIN